METGKEVQCVGGIGSVDGVDGDTTVSSFGYWVLLIDRRSRVEI